MNLKCIVAVLSLAAPAIVLAQSGSMKGMDMKQEKATAGTVHKASGKVRKVDAAKGTVTIAHGPVPSINWPAMTMAFRAKDQAMLGKVKNGDQVEFSFVESGGHYTITAIR